MEIQALKIFNSIKLILFLILVLGVITVLTACGDLVKESDANACNSAIDARNYETAKSICTDRKDIAKASALNVSAHFLVARDGTIYRLMPETWMARHVIGLNYSSIGVENVGGSGNKKEDLTPAQLKSNIKLVRYLKEKYPTITHLIGHYEYRELEGTELWLEQDKGYRTQKNDPGKKFMKAVRQKVKDLNLTKL